MAKRLPPQRRAIDKAKATLGEHFEAGVIIVPAMQDGESQLYVETFGHASFGKGLIEDAYKRVFEDESEFGSGSSDEADEGDESDGDTPA